MEFKQEFTDSIDLNTQSSRRIKDEANGYLTVLGNPIALAGVHPYRESDVLSNGDANTIVNVYKPFDELAKAKDNFKQKPIIKGHPWTGAKGANHRADGAIGSEVWHDNQKTLYSDIIIYNPEVIKDIEDGVCTNLSPGFLANVEQKAGEHEGVHYDYVMSDFKINHLGLVNRGRAGHDLRILDEDTCMDLKKESNEQIADTHSLRSGGAEKAPRHNSVYVDSDSACAEVSEPTQAAEAREETKQKFFSKEEVKEIMASFRQDILDELSKQKQQELTSQKEEMQKVFKDQLDLYKDSQRQLINTKSQVELNIGRPIMDECNTVEDVYKYGYQALTGMSLPAELHAQTAYITALQSKGISSSHQAMFADSDDTNSSVSEEFKEMHDSVNEFIKRVF